MLATTICQIHCWRQHPSTLDHINSTASLVYHFYKLPDMSSLASPHLAPGASSSSSSDFTSANTGPTNKSSFFCIERLLGSDHHRSSSSPVLTPGERRVPSPLENNSECKLNIKFSPSPLYFYSCLFHFVVHFVLFSNNIFLFALSPSPFRSNCFSTRQIQTQIERTAVNLITKEVTIRTKKFADQMWTSLEK